MSDLGPDCDRTRILSFVTRHRKEALQRLLETPGVEQIRAGLLRMLPELLDDDEERAKILAKIGPVLTNASSTPDQPPSGELTRHPAWIGLSILEYSDLMGREDGGLDWAIEFAGAAFRETRWPLWNWKRRNLVGYG